MSEGNTQGREAVVARKRGLSLVWLIPVVATVIGGYLAYEAITSRGPQFTITFNNADGLVAGKTKITFRSVEIGHVEDIQISKDFSHIVVTCRGEPTHTRGMTDGAKFWVVRPRIGAGGVSGLSTLLSGSYIAALPGTIDAKPKRAFKGLENPPMAPTNAPGLKVVLHSDELSSLNVGSPVLYRRIEVGVVEGYDFADNEKGVDIRVYIHPQYNKLVKTGSRFWDASGLDVGIGAGGVDVDVESLGTLLIGGIAFDSPRGDAATNGASYLLHANRKELTENTFRYGGLSLVLVTNQLRGVQAGDRVYYREEEVGAVASHALSADRTEVRIHINIQRQYANLVRHNSVFWNAGGISADLSMKGLKIHTETIEALLAGGIAFATPSKGGSVVKAGSVFLLYDEENDDWKKWGETLNEDGKPGLMSRIFHHHSGKGEEEAAKDQDPEQKDPSKSHKHHFLSKIFGGD
ncbi:MAG: MlaD family protein [Myxococcota bacterium]|nr:MlaD family protein [Myxococcota bacterium]